MAEMSSREHVFRLSTLDQAENDEYIRCCFCFVCPSTTTDLDEVIEEFGATVKRTVNHLPILAGRILPAVTKGGPPENMEMVVKLEDVTSFQPIVKHPSQRDFPYNLEDLEKGCLPPSALANELLSPIENDPSHLSHAVFAVQANVFVGGVLVVLCLHRMCGDTVSLGVIAKHLSRDSRDLSTHTITEDSLKDEALEQSRLRDRLSGSRGIKSDIARNAYPNSEASLSSSSNKNKAGSKFQASTHVLIFSLSFLTEVRDLINQRFQYIHGDHTIQLSCFEALAAILWKGFSRALLFRRDLDPKVAHAQSQSCLIMPLNARKTIEPEIDDAFLGNATIPVTVASPIVNISMPFEPGTLARTARSIHDTVQGVSEQSVRSIIAGINESSDPKAYRTINTATDTIVTSWADLGLECAHLGLGLGPPRLVRKISNDSESNDCTIHPPRDGECEVTVQLSEDVMESLLGDESFMAFVARVV